MGLHGLLLLPLLVLLSSHSRPSFGNSSIENRLYGTGRGAVVENADDRVGVRTSEVSLAVVNVEDFGARGDGTDATVAFRNAWTKVCSSAAPATMVVPVGKNYLLKPITFSGPCKSNVTVMLRIMPYIISTDCKLKMVIEKPVATCTKKQIKGTIEAPSDRSYWSTKSRQWILFSGIDNLRIGGGGTINGNGEVWWQNSCKISKSRPCKDAPTALTIYSCNAIVVEDLTVKDSQQIHVEFEKCNNVRAHHLTISAPESSPNTDGIHITRTKNILIDNCVIGTGDDCISIVSGSQNVKATNIVCGPGHGISIGSLGGHQSEDEVSYVTVDTAKLKDTTNGVRIKTWQGGSGYAKHIRFQNINMNNVKNPIIIDQKYCDSTKQCKEQKSAVQVSDVHYQNIKGTSASDVAIDFQCSKSFPCQGIVLQGIDLLKNNGGAAKSSCANVNLIKNGNVIPPPCA